MSSNRVFNPSKLPGVFKIEILYMFGRPNFGPYMSQTVSSEGQKPIKKINYIVLG